jgi:hypothetical protein
MIDHASSCKMLSPNTLLIEYISGSESDETMLPRSMQARRAARGWLAAKVQARLFGLSGSLACRNRTMVWIVFAWASDLGTLSQIVTDLSDKGACIGVETANVAAAARALRSLNPRGSVRKAQHAEKKQG